jgi:hypothetical protein
VEVKGVFNKISLVQFYYNPAFKNFSVFSSVKLCRLLEQIFTDLGQIAAMNGKI